MSPYRKQAPIFEPDPFPAASATDMKTLIERKIRRVAFLARKLVATTKAAGVARASFPEAHVLRRRTDEAVLRSFEQLDASIDEWKRLEEG